MTKGGKREGAGRPKGSGPYGEKTVTVRLPISLAGYIVTWCRIFCNEGERDVIKTYNLYKQQIEKKDE